MTLRVVLTDGNGIQGLTGVFGSFLTTSSADAKAAADAAKASAEAAAASASQSANSASQSAQSAGQAQTYANQASGSATQASNAATAAGNSALQASNSATQAANSATAADSSANAANNSAGQAGASASAAAGSATQAGNSASAAAGSASAAAGNATNSANSANLAKDWATKLGGTVDGVDYSAKYYAQQASTQVGLSLLKANNLSDVANAPTALANIGGVPIAGNVTMTGPLTLNADPVANLGAATKQYVDTKTAAVNNAALLKANNLSDVADLPTAQKNLKIAGIAIMYALALG